MYAIRLEPRGEVSQEGREPSTSGGCHSVSVHPRLSLVSPLDALSTFFISPVSSWTVGRSYRSYNAVSIDHGGAIVWLQAVVWNIGAERTPQ